MRDGRKASTGKERVKANVGANGVEGLTPRRPSRALFFFKVQIGFG